MEHPDVKIPSGQISWERHYSTSGKLLELITSDKTKEKWFLYGVDTEGALVLRATGKSPARLSPVKRA